MKAGYTLQKDRKELLKCIWRILPWVWMILGAMFDIWYEIVPGKWILDSDLASDMVLSNHLNQTHQIISKEWFYSSELTVFESQWFYRIGLIFSPDNWHVARVIAAVLIYIVFIAVLLFFAKSIGLGNYAPWLAAIMMWPFGRWYLVYGLYGNYYLIYMMFSMASTGIILRLCRLEQGCAATGKRKLKLILLYFAGLFCGIGSGLNGVKQTMVYFGPLFLTGAVLLFWAGYRKKAVTLFELWDKCRAECLFALNAALFTAANVAGYLVNLKILSRLYSFDSYNYMVYLDERTYRLYDILMDFLRLFGYVSDVDVLSARGIASTLGLVFAAVFVISLVRMHRRFHELETGAQITVLSFDFAILLDAVVYCLMGYYKIYYWLPMLPFAVAVIVLELRTERIPMRYFRNWVLVGIALILPALSWGAVKAETERPLFSTHGYRELTDFLLENDLTEGYASFWNSAVLREMSSGRIQTWTLYNVSDNAVIYDWMQEKEKKETAPEGRCFLILNEERDGRAEDSVLVRFGSGELIYEDGPLRVYEFETPEKIQQAVEEFQKSLKEG